MKGSIFIADKVYVDVTLDDYEKGALEHVNSWDFSLTGKVFPDKASLIESINDASCLDVDDVTFFDGSIRFSVMVDNDNIPPSKAQYERWKKGEEKLYIADGFMHADFLPEVPHEMTEEEAESFGIKIE